MCKWLWIHKRNLFVLMSAADVAQTQAAPASTASVAPPASDRIPPAQEVIYSLWDEKLLKSLKFIAVKQFSCKFDRIFTLQHWNIQIEFSSNLLFSWSQWSDSADKQHGCQTRAVLCLGNQCAACTQCKCRSESADCCSSSWHISYISYKSSGLLPVKFSVC